MGQTPKKFPHYRCGEKQTLGKMSLSLTWIQVCDLNRQASTTMVLALSLPTGGENVKTEPNLVQKINWTRHFIKGYEAENGPLNTIKTGEFLLPRDANGHGSHTLSTAAGNFVENVSIYGYAKGIAKGGAPHARVASYKVCWPDTDNCYAYEADIIAGFDAGVYDGVDVFSISLGSAPPLADFFQDGIAIGAFHAVQRGKMVLCSAGNDGPTQGTVSNVAPWIMTVGASSIDRKFYSYAVLGNKKAYKGQSLSESPLPKRKMYPLVSAVDVRAHGTNETSGKYCLLGSLNARKVKGKIVACLIGVNARVEKGKAVSMAGVGMILCNPPNVTFQEIADSHVLPVTQISGTDGQAVFNYINSTVYPFAYISPPRTTLRSSPDPFMAAFSSKGPSSLTSDILKPLEWTIPRKKSRRLQ